MKKTFKSKFKFNTRTLYAYSDPNKRIAANGDTTPLTSTSIMALAKKV
jgi:hypothetical protein